MTKKEIMNNYAKEQGYEDWKELLSDEKAFLFETMIHIDNVTDLIQVELKERIKEGYYKNYHAEFDTLIDILIPLIE